MIEISPATDTLRDFVPLSPSAVTLSDSQVRRAMLLSQRAAGDRPEHWEIYLQALAFVGFEQWLADRGGPSTLDASSGSIQQPAYAALLPAVCNLRVGDFRLCLLATGSLTDSQVALPRAVLDLPEFAAHFCVLIEVGEETAQVQVRGCLPYTSLLQHLQETPLVAEADWTYRVPLSWFEGEPDDLLLWLRCLEVAAIGQATMPGDPAAATQLQAALRPLLPQLQQPDLPLWQVLNWEQGAALLRQPDVVDWLYRQRHASLGDIPAASLPLADAPVPLSCLAQRAIDLGKWLQGELDELARELAWVLLPPLGSNALRSTEEEVESILGELEREGVEIPPSARGAYRDLRWEGVNLRLYAITWPLLSPANVPEWTLLLILGPQMGTQLPTTTRLLVRDAVQLLVEQTPSPDSDGSYLYARVAGAWEEQFWVTIDLNNGAPGTVMHLPPFQFGPGQIFP